MAWIVKLPPTPRHPQTRWQVRYRDGTTQRSAGIYPTKAAARSVQRAVERGDRVAISDQLSPQPGCMLFGEYIATIWWPAWKPAHPRSADGTRSKLTGRILPRFGNLPLAQLDAHVVAAWQRDLNREGLSPRTTATYLSLLGTICNAAVKTGYLDHSPLTVPGDRRRRSATLSATPTEPALPRMVWLTRPQVHQLADAIDPRYRALVILAAHTGARWSELTTLRWIDVRTNFSLDDGAISGPGRLRLRPPSPADQEEPARRGGHDPDPAGAPSPSTSTPSTPSTPTATWSTAGPSTWSSPAPAAPAARPASSQQPTSPASGTEPSPPPDSGRPAPTSSGRISATCATPTPSGCSPSRPPSAPSPNAWATPTP